MLPEPGYSIYCRYAGVLLTFLNLVTALRVRAAGSRSPISISGAWWLPGLLKGHSDLRVEPALTPGTGVETQAAEVVCCPARATQSQASSQGPPWPGGCSKQGNGVSDFLGRSLSAVYLETKDTKPSANPSFEKVMLGNVAKPLLCGRAATCG